MAAGLRVNDRTTTCGYCNFAILTSNAVEPATYRGPLAILYVPI